jgi:hypothetical protein
LIKVLEEAGQAVPKELGDLANTGSSYGSGFGNRSAFGNRPAYGNRPGYGNARY